VSQAFVSGLTIEYESFGNRGDPAILLIQGLGGQLIHWPDCLCRELVARGYFVIRFDNRDIGLSSRLDHLPLPDLSKLQAAARGGLCPSVPYTLFDMAADAVGLLDAMCIEKAHVAGASMGGTIAQFLAARYPQRCLSLTTIMSTTGHPSLPTPDPALLMTLLAPVVPQDDIEGLTQRGLAIGRMLMSPGFPTAEPLLLAAVSRAVLRGGDGYAGRIRQMAAAMVAPDTRDCLSQLRLPVHVLHGRDDPLIPFAAAEDIAASAPGAALQLIDGMGHDFPVALMPVFADAIHSAARRA
jgi:pimeloyl-ACP methyl ester carboxylesterase